MKKVICAVSLLLITVMLGSMTAVAAQADSDDVYAAATTQSGRQIVLADAPDADVMGGLDSYSLMIENEPVLEVAQSDVPDITSGADNNGYFSVSFDLPDTEKQVFLAGLSAGKVEEIQSRIIAQYASGADFELEDLSFIDAEKMFPSNDGDDMLCWAATTSNMLTYTGWAARAGFRSTDDVFEAMIASFTDVGNAVIYGIGWFFNGVNAYEMIMPGQAATAAAGTGGYLSDYACDQLAKDINLRIDAVNGMRQMYRSLKEGCGVGIGTSVYNSMSGSLLGGHAMTCWGYIADTAYTQADPRYYAGLFLTDSDSDEPESGDRRDAKNVLKTVSLTNGADANGSLTFEFDLYTPFHCVLSEFETLIPYSPDVEKETSARATRSKVNTPDLIVSNFFLNTVLTGSDFMISNQTIESGQTFYYTPLITNYADAAYSGRTSVSVEFKDANGYGVYSRNLSNTLSIPAYGSVSYVKSLTKSDGLPAGDYTVTVTLNGNQSVSEAYYYNNTYTYPLKVRDSYLLGDADGSGQVDIMDATKIQRLIAGFDAAQLNDALKQRAQITSDEMNIMDATQIQRFIASLSIRCAVGEKRLYQ